MKANEELTTRTAHTRGPMGSGQNRPPVLASNGGPLMIDIELIDEDPAQPRTMNNPGFRPESIAELAASYGPKGPKTPLSLRVHPDTPGRYIINHGHRRYRAGKVKGLSTLPAFIDNDYDDADQVIENLQRENMTPREIADYIGRELAKGRKKKEIAARIGKSPSFVSQHVTLLDLPEPVATVFRSGRVTDVTVLNELVSAFKVSPADVAHWLNNPSQEMTRGEIRHLREFLAEKRRSATTSGDGGGEDDYQIPVDEQNAVPGLVTQQESSRKMRKARIQVEHEGRRAYLLLSRRPRSNGRAWVRFEDDEQEVDVALAEIQLVAILGV